MNTATEPLTLTPEPWVTGRLSSDIMPEDLTEKEQLFKPEEEPKEPSPGGGSLKGSIVKAFVDIRGLFTKSAEKTPKPAEEVKKPAVSMSSLFSARKIDLEFINKSLIFILIGLIFVVIYVTFRQRPDISSVMASVSRIKFTEVEPKEIKPFEQVSFYVDQMKTRDIFTVFEEKKEPVKVEEPPPPPPPPPPSEPKVTIEEKARNLKLMGISWGERPKAIIRDERAQDMYFLREGETIKGTDVKIKTITSDSVIIISGEDEMTMF